MTSPPAARALAALAATAAAAPAAASPAAPGAGEAARRRADKVLVAVRADGPIAIDGRLDEPTWQAARFADDFAQKEPFQDAPPSERTEIAIAFDREALYVAARMALADPARLDRPMTRRDETSGAERIIVSLDPRRSGRTAYSFAVTAAGVRADWIHTDDSEGARDHAWNPVWSAAVEVGPDAWTAELRIPWSQLRFPDDPVPVWGINVNRYTPRTGEDVFWIVVPKDRTGWASYFGELRGLRELAAGPRVELLPYLAGDLHVRSRATLDAADPFADPLAPGGGAGLDAKIGVGPSLTLDATVNPDFGQVEADPAVVNLSAFEVRFPERRPFFVEGAPIFASNPRAYFYSRRIGAPPPRRPAGDFVDAPDAARILAAGKLTGAVAPRTQLGALAAVTGAARARVATADDAGGIAIEDATVAPTTGWGVLRIEREGAGGSVGGIMLTGVTRELDDPALAALLPRAAVTGGGDLRLRMRDGAYEVFVAAGGSAIAGTPAAIERAQRASARWFQRPDADHVEVDPTRTVLTGWHAEGSAARRAGRWRFEAGLGAESPGLELNELGVLASGDDVDLWAAVQRVETAPGRRLHGWSIGLRDAEAWNFGGLHKPAATELSASATLPRFHRVGAAIVVTRPGQSDDLTRGGPRMGVGWGLDVSASAGGPNTGRLVWSISGAASWSETDTDGGVVSGQLLWRAIDRLRFQVNPRLRRARVHQHYVAAVAGAGGGDDTFGTRYVFAALDRREAAVQVRAQLALSPDLTVDAYVEPFASSGRFDGFGELPAPGARRIRRYDEAAVRRDGGRVAIGDGDGFELAEPDFTVLSLRSTIVLRWELRPGSTLYAVWQQARGRGDPTARGVGPRVLGDALTAPGEHVVAVKLSYWYGL